MSDTDPSVAAGVVDPSGAADVKCWYLGNPDKPVGDVLPNG